MEDRPTLAAGNAFVIEPSEITPFTTVALMRLLTEAGPPVGAGDPVGAGMAEHPAVDLVTVTAGTTAPGGDA